MSKPQLSDDGILLFQIGQFILFGQVQAEDIPTVQRELENSAVPTVRHGGGSYCTIYETDRYTLIHDLQKRSSICFHGAKLYKIDLMCKVAD